MPLRNRSLFKEEQCFFVTTTCNKWYHLTASANSFRIVSESLNFCATKFKADILGYVIMPNHLHLILYFREENHLSDFMRDFKKFTSVKLRHEIENVGETKVVEALRFEIRKQKFKVWMERFDDVVLYSKDVVMTKLNYIHNNPLQKHWQLAEKTEDYKYSSALEIVRCYHLTTLRWKDLTAPWCKYPGDTVDRDTTGVSSEACSQVFPPDCIPV